MAEILTDLSYWHWLALAFVMLALEIVAPVTFFMWLSMAAVLSAVVKLIFPDIGLTLELTLFALFCIGSLVAWHFYGISGRETETDNPQLNQRNERYLGRVVEVTEAIREGVGKVTVEDSQWKVYGPDAEVGARVRVIGVDGSIFNVEAA